MPVHVQGPDGSIVEFPDGTPTNVMQSAMQAHYGAAKDQPAQPADPSLLDQLRHAGAMGLRNTVQGLASIPAAINDPIVAGINKGADALGLGPAWHGQTTGQALDTAMTAAGVPDAQPQNGTERVAGDMTRGAASALTGVGIGGALRSAASPVLAGIGDVMASNAGTQLASGTSGAGAAGMTREAGGGTGAQVAASLLGGLVPSAPQIGSAALRGLIRGGAKASDPALVDLVNRGLMGKGEAGRQQMLGNMADFQRAGTDSTVGQATQNSRMQGLESLLAKAPGSSGVMRGAAENQAAQVSDGLDTIASKLAPHSDPARTGRVIERGIVGPDGFKDKFKQTAGALYDKLDQHIAPDTRVDVSNTLRVLPELNQTIPGAPNTSKLFQNSRIAGIQQGLQQDTHGIDAVNTRPGVAQKVESLKGTLQFSDSAINQNNVLRKALGQKPIDPLGQQGIDGETKMMLGQMVDGKLPYEAVKKLRTLVGNEIDNASIVSDVPRSKWKAVYAALSQDLGAAADQAGPEAKNAFSRANAYYNAGTSRLDALSTVLDKSGGPEAIYNAATSGTRDGATTLRTVMQSLKPDEQKVLASTMIRRMGKATAGQQNADGDQFSMNTFLTNWNKLSPQAKTTMFDRFGPGFRSDMDAVSRMASNVRQGSKVFANPSGSASSTAQLGTVGGFIMAALGGHLATAAAIGAGATSTNLVARAMTNPTFVKFIAQTSKVPLQGLVPMLASLHRTAQASNDVDLKEIDAQLQQAANQ